MYGFWLGFLSADLGGRVGWLPKAERVKTLFLSPLQPQNRGGVGGGVGGVSRLRFPPGPHLRRSRFSRHPRLRQAPTRRFAKNRGLGGFCWRAGPQALGARAPSPLETWPTGPWGPPLSAVDFLQSVSNPLSPGQNPRLLPITPNPLTLGGVGWFPKATVP